MCAPLLLGFGDGIAVHMITSLLVQAERHDWRAARLRPAMPVDGQGRIRGMLHTSTQYPHGVCLTEKVTTQVLTSSSPRGWGAGCRQARLALSPIATQTLNCASCTSAHIITTSEVLDCAPYTAPGTLCRSMRVAGCAPSGFAAPRHSGTASPGLTLAPMPPLISLHALHHLSMLPLFLPPPPPLRSMQYVCLLPLLTCCAFLAPLVAWSQGPCAMMCTAPPFRCCFEVLEAPLVSSKQVACQVVRLVLRQALWMQDPLPLLWESCVQS